MPGRKLVRHIAVTISILSAACGREPVEPTPDPPAISVQGVRNGEAYAGPVTITIGVDRGSYTATLDGKSFVSGRVVSEAGPHELVVRARNGATTATLEVRFTIGAAGRRLIVRIFNLSDNDSGGGGDAILLTDSSSAGQAHGLIDAGPAGTGGSDFNFVRNRLQALGVDSLEFVQLTHAHGDHYLGMTAVLNAFDIKRFIYNGQLRSLASYNTVVNLGNTRADSTIVPATPYTFTMTRDTASTTLTVLPPLPTHIGTSTDDGEPLNEGSLGTHLRLGTFRMFFTGDGQVAANNRWRAQYAALTRNIDVLKVGHHGANNAIFDNGFNGTATWLDHTAPAVSIISANGTTHPRINALTRLLNQLNNRTYCTNVHGQIELRIEQDDAYSVTVEKNEGMDCVAGRESNS